MAYPETDKLIRLGEIFDCSLDYLLKDDITEPISNERLHENTEEVVEQAVRNIFRKMRNFEKKSKRYHSIWTSCIWRGGSRLLCDWRICHRAVSGTVFVQRNARIFPLDYKNCGSCNIVKKSLHEVYPASCNFFLCLYLRKYYNKTCVQHFRR